MRPTRRRRSRHGACRHEAPRRAAPRAAAGGARGPRPGAHRLPLRGQALHPEPGRHRRRSRRGGGSDARPAGRNASLPRRSAVRARASHPPGGRLLHEHLLLGRAYRHARGRSRTLRQGAPDRGRDPGPAVDQPRIGGAGARVRHRAALVNEAAIDRDGLAGHPRGLTTLFFTELWERFSYYGMRALLILFMVAGADRGGLGFDVKRAASIYGLYTSAVYFMAIPGGWMADRFLGQRRAVLCGGILIALGHFSLAVDTLPTFFAGLVLIVSGTG